MAITRSGFHEPYPSLGCHPKTKNKHKSSPVNGFANGGYNGRSDEENVMVSSNNPELLKVLTQLLMLFSELRAKGMRAYIVYSDIEAAQKTTE